MSVVNGSFNNPQPCEEHAALPLAGGLEQMGFQCGQLWGAALAAGAQAYRVYGPGPRAEAAAVIVSQRLAESFHASYKSINCSEVIQLDWKKPQTKQILSFLLTGGPIRCFTMTAGYARAAFTEINTAFSGDDFASSFTGVDAPVSCAAMLAHKMGATEMQAVMAAGFAGGIGLSGGACGALGAAIWLLAVQRGREGEVDYNSPEALDAIDRFVEATEVKFDCSEIVGRKFVNAGDHARYVCGGGCSEIIRVLANTGKE